jgi:hypothetical protein
MNQYFLWILMAMFVAVGMYQSLIRIPSLLRGSSPEPRAPIVFQTTSAASINLTYPDASGDITQSGQPSNDSKWSKGDIVELVTLVIGIPAGLAALVALGRYASRYRYLQPCK